jgi:MFS family permease
VSPVRDGIGSRLSGTGSADAQHDLRGVGVPKLPKPLVRCDQGFLLTPLSVDVDFYTFLMPLYALSLEFDAAEVGILVGARSIVAMFLSIHIGVLMDRFGTRKVTLFFVWVSMVLAPLVPLVPWFWSLLVLQLLNGAAVSFAWSRGSNTDRAAG